MIWCTFAYFYLISAPFGYSFAEKSIDLVGAFFNEIRLAVSEILLRNMKYAYTHEIFASQMLRGGFYFTWSAKAENFIKKCRRLNI